MDTRKRRSWLIPLLLGVCLVVPASSAWADGCKASLNPRLMKKEKARTTITHMFKVDVKSPERCADVDYVLKIVESASGEKDRNMEQPHHTRVRDGVVTSAKVNYKTSNKNTVVSWTFEVVSCDPCGAAKTD